MGHQEQRSTADCGRVFRQPYPYIGLAISLAGHLLVISAAAQIYRGFYNVKHEPMLEVLGTAVFENVGTSSGADSKSDESNGGTAGQKTEETVNSMPSRILTQTVHDTQTLKRHKQVKLIKPQIDSSAAAGIATTPDAGQESTVGGLEEININSNGMGRGIKRPHYPVLSRKLGEEGRVVLQVTTLPTGSVQGVEIEKSSGYPRLDGAAKEALQASLFSTSTSPVRRIAFNFKLK